MAVKTEPGTRKEGQDHRQIGRAPQGMSLGGAREEGRVQAPSYPRRSVKPKGMDRLKTHRQLLVRIQTPPNVREGGDIHGLTQRMGGGPATRERHWTRASTALGAGDFTFQSLMPYYTAARRYKMRGTR